MKQYLKTKPGKKRVAVVISHLKDIIRHTKLFRNEYQEETQTFFPALTLNINNLFNIKANPTNFVTLPKIYLAAI